MALKSYNILGSLDANIILRLVLRDLPEQSDLALDLVERDGLFHVSDVAIIEVVFALERYYEISRIEINKIVSAIIGNSKLILNRELFINCMQIYVKHPKLSIEDCCLAIYAKLNNAKPLWTFDKKLGLQVSDLCKLL